MLWLHIGMPKTGTTALQGFVRGHGELLAQAGLRYMEAGRRNLDGTGRVTISHNRIAFHINQTNETMDAYREQIDLEYSAHEDKTCLVSSEMFYTADLTRLAEVFADIPARDLRIVFYCRRYSDFFEADYKQRAKNGRLYQVGTPHIAEQLSQIKQDPSRWSYAAKVAQIRRAFPGVTIVPLLYDRNEMKRGNVVDDFLHHLGVNLPASEQSETASNPSQSRAASEAFGIVTRAMGRKASRQLRRTVVDGPVMIRRNDVLEPQERFWLDEFLAEQDHAFRREFFPDLSRLFPKVELSEDDLSFRRDTAQEYENLQKATEVVFRMALNT